MIDTGLFNTVWDMLLTSVDTDEMYNIIYHGFLSQPRRGSHVKSDNTHTIIRHTTLSPLTLHMGLEFRELRTFYCLPKPHHVTASHPSPGDNHQSMGGRSERTIGWEKMSMWNSISYLFTRALHSFLSFMHCRAASTVIPLLPKATL